MRSRKRRRLDWILSGVAAFVVGIVTGIGAAVGDSERIGSLWISARLDTVNGNLAVTEVIDYDFGVQQRHGIYRDVPDLVEGAPITVSSPTAPDGIVVSRYSWETNIRVGDPRRTISNRHRYQIDFVIDGGAVDVSSAFSWQAVGTEWTVPIEQTEIWLALPFDIGHVTCGYGNQFRPSECHADVPEPGLVHVLVGNLDAGQGVQLTVLRGSGSESPPLSLIRAPSGPADDPGSGLVAPALAAILGALALTVPAAALIRRLGREQVRSGGAVAAAFDADDDGPVERMSERQMERITTIEFESPRGMSAVEGALIVDENVKDHHKTAWMLESAIRGEIEIRSDDDEIHRGDSIPAPTVSPILSEMFGGRGSIPLGSHDTKFQKGWTRLDSELKGWLRESDHWDPSARSRRTLIGLLAGLISLAGLGVAFGGGWVANKSGTTLLIAAIGGGLLALGANGIIRFWELHVRTPAGSARWLQVESFRRFLHESEAEHVEYAASRGLIRQYSAWAVALDETDAWTDAVRAATVSQAGRISAGDLAFVYGVSSFHRSTAVASTTPSSSGSGFSGGGGGFSGGGGGGGGSW